MEVAFGRRDASVSRRCCTLRSWLSRDAATWVDAKQQYANCCYTNFTLNHAPNMHNILTCPHCLLLASGTTTALFTMLPCLGIADQSLPRDIHETPRH